MGFKLIKQHDIKDCGAACLSMVCRFFGLKLPMAKFRELIKVDNNGANIYGIVDGADKIGLKADGLQGNASELLDSARKKEFHLPVIARVIIDNKIEHYVVVYRITKKHFFVADPAKGKKKYLYKDFFDIWSGHIIAFEKTDSFTPRNECKGMFGKFFKLLSHQKKLLFFVIVFSLLISSISILGSVLFRIIVDGINKSSFNGFSLKAICIGTIILYFIQAIISILRGYSLSILSKNIDISIMLNFYNHIVDLPMKDISTRKTGEFLSRFNDASNIRDAVSGASLSLFLDTTMVIVCIFVLYTTNHILFFISLSIVILYAIIAALFVSPIKNTNEKLMDDNAEITSYIKESIDGIETVKSFCCEKKVKEKTKKKYKKFIKNMLKCSVLYTVEDSLSVWIASVGVVVLLWIGAILVMENIVSLGTLIMFYSLLGFFLTPIRNLIELQPVLQNAIVASDRLNDILELDIEEETADSAEIGSNISFQNVDFRYGNRNLVLKNINLEIKSGEKIAIVGESGSGKTTLVKLIMAFYKPENGKIMIGNADLSRYSPKTIRQNIAYISQDLFLFSDSVLFNLTLGNKNISLDEVKKICKQCLADDFIEKMPMGYHTLLGENGYNLSGGQKQRIAIARALLQKPKILIMDEATSNLDTITESSIKNTIENICGEITCIMIAHRLSTVRHCDRICVMKNGEIAELGTHRELMLQNGLYKNFYEEKVQ